MQLNLLLFRGFVQPLEDLCSPLGFVAVPSKSSALSSRAPWEKSFKNMSSPTRGARSSQRFTRYSVGGS